MAFSIVGALQRRGAHRASKLVGAAALAVALTCTSVVAQADDWIGTWTASVQPVWEPDFPVPTNIPRNLWNQTVRQTVRASIGGKQVRVIFTNEYGTQPLLIGAAHVALADKGSAIVAGSDRKLTFGGKNSIEIPPGAPAISDPVALDVAPLARLSVSLFVPRTEPTSSMHWDGHDTAYIVAGDQTAAADFKPDSSIVSRIFLSGVMVDAAADARAIVTFGDSITDGDGSTVDGFDRWPDNLAARLVQAGGPPVAVLNQGISGAMIRKDRMGVNALARFDRDVLNQPHVTTVTLMMGINDIGWPGCGLAPNDKEPTAEEIIAGYQQLVTRAHLHGLRIIGVTLTPFGDSFAGTPFEGYYSEAKEKIRVAVNEWIRNSGEFDGVIDFDKVVRDPAKPSHIQAQYDKGDHLHPNPAGYKAMADAIDLNQLLGNK
ncbi:SGNH/GDSL hydrolase family protein [Dongia sp. agr-C8]